MMTTKKELKAAYKQMKSPMGVFQIRNKSNERILVDNGTNMESKWNRHKTELRFGSHRNQALQNDWNTSGESNFEYQVLSELDTDDTPNVNFQKELKTLQKMVVEDLNLNADLLY